MLCLHPFNTTGNGPFTPGLVTALVCIFVLFINKVLSRPRPVATYMFFYLHPSVHPLLFGD